MMPVEFLSFLLNKDGSSYYLDNGVVNTSTTPTPTKHLADGWQDTKILWERNLKYMASFRSLTTPYKFIKDAAFIARSRAYNNGPEEKIYLVSKWLDKSFGGGWIHKTLFKGELDLSQAKNSLTGINIPIAEGDLYKLFKANETTPYSIPITGPYVQDDGIQLSETAKINIIDGVEMFFGNPGHADQQSENIFTSVVSTEGKSSGLVFIDQTAIFGPDGFAQADAGNSGPIVLRVFGSASFVCNVNERDVMKIRFRKSTEGVLAGGISVFNAHITPGNTYSFTFDLTVSLLPGENLIFDASPQGVGTVKITFLPNSNFRASFDNRYKTTYTRVMRPMELGQALLDKITGGGYTLVSNYFSNVWENLTVTSGDAIRGITDPVIKTSWADFFDSYNVPTNICMDIQTKTIRIEPKANAFDSTVVYDMGEVKDMEDGPDEDFQYNGLSIGYPNLDQSTYESLNAKEEFNVTSNFTTNITRYSKKLELISKYHASMYEQELARINLDGKDSTAASVDDTVFFKLIEKNYSSGATGAPPQYYKYFRDTYTSITGLKDPASAYNVPLSPMNCLLRQGNYLRSIFFWQSGSNLTYTFSDQTTTLKTVKGGVTIDERANVSVGALAAPLFIPHAFNTNSPMRRQLLTTMKNTPYGTFQFSWLGDTYFGFVKSVSIMVANRPAQDSVFMCSPQTDLKNLIR